MTNITCKNDYEHNFVAHKGDVSIPCIFCTYHIDNSLSTQCTYCRNIACKQCLEDRKLAVFEPITQQGSTMSLAKKYELLTHKIQQLEERLSLLEISHQSQPTQPLNQLFDSDEETENKSTRNSIAHSLPVISCREKFKSLLISLKIVIPGLDKPLIGLGFVDTGCSETRIDINSVPQNLRLNLKPISISDSELVKLELKLNGL